MNVNNTWTEEDYAEYFNERAAVYQFDGGLNRKEADARAAKDVERLKQLQAESKQCK